MRAYSLRKAKEMVRLYNETKNVHKVADMLQLPLVDVKKILKWLHEHDPENEKACQRRTFEMRVPNCRVWAQFLYGNDIPAHTAAACCNWPLQRLLESCGGPTEWAKTSGRTPIALHMNDVTGGREERGQMEKDPNEEEIALAAKAIRENWHPNDSRRPEMATVARVETRQYAYDNRSGKFDGI